MSVDARYIIGAIGVGIGAPRIFPALVFGIVTVVFPLFVLQPSLGLGVASSKTVRPARARLKSLVTHVVFGLGLYLFGFGANHLLQVSG